MVSNSPQLIDNMDKAGRMLDIEAARIAKENAPPQGDAGQHFKEIMEKDFQPLSEKEKRLATLEVVKQRNVAAEAEKRKKGLQTLKNLGEIMDDGKSKREFIDEMESLRKKINDDPHKLP